MAPTPLNRRSGPRPRAAGPACLGILLAVALLAGPVAPASAQAPDAGEAPIQVLVLGVYHFSNPGLDVVQTTVPDHLAPEQQEQILRVVDGLAGFRPTRIAVEQQSSDAERLDALLAAYRDGRHELTANETQQIGFRLADRFDLERVHPFDHRGDFPFEPVMEYAAEHDPAAAERIQDVIAEITRESNLQHRDWTVGEILHRSNEPGELERGHAFYVEVAGVGAGDTQVGADLLSAWYERNIRMFSNLRAIAEPGDRLLVIVGSGHAPILRELVTADPGMDLVDPLGYLPER